MYPGLHFFFLFSSLLLSSCATYTGNYVWYNACHLSRFAKKHSQRGKHNVDHIIRRKKKEILVAVPVAGEINSAVVLQKPSPRRNTDIMLFKILALQAEKYLTSSTAQWRLFQPREGNLYIYIYIKEGDGVCRGGAGG